MFSEKMIAFYADLEPTVRLPKGIHWIEPFGETVMEICDIYHKRFYHDNRNRTFLFGINPGRFGAGVTGIPFTDPIYLETVAGIKNDLQKRHELSSIFIHEMIQAYGGLRQFSKQFYISSLCPLGFIKEGKNINYYDDKLLEKRVSPFIMRSIENQLKIGANPKVAISLGNGKNYKYFKMINEKKGYFEKIIPLPHPRWIMQYKRKDKEKHLAEYMRVLKESMI